MPSQPSLPAVLRVSGSIVTSLMLLGFCIPIMGAGHGIAPIGLLLVMGSFDAWGLEMAASWIGIAASLASLFGGGRTTRLTLRTLGLALLAVAFGLFIQISEAREMTLVTGGIFILSALILFIMLLFAFSGRSNTAPAISHDTISADSRPTNGEQFAAPNGP